MMRVWNMIEAKAKTFAPGASSEEIYQMTKGVMEQQLGAKGAA
jgi:hypothetical protein